MKGRVIGNYHFKGHLKGSEDIMVESLWHKTSGYKTFSQCLKWCQRHLSTYQIIDVNEFTGKQTEILNTL